ncbi:MAG: HupE/UreJ family protein [Candidatus Pseudobacter hemicellulosilyticus]|uniref:HupE/UreJ family protein n=1 Tax=Candidatus Pseudobacter hemicellulosilyticus TaxID=3121375 RepID=A0AAJ5WR42_9BACT|nr:MAG: HupE/UreJ family protein [Pseudobacter sp.]
MQDFTIYFKLGVEHILSLDAMDHILFVTALCLRYLSKDWKKVVILVTAFTIGHSLTLALSALGLVNFDSSWIEFLIPLTIAATCINNMLQPANAPASRLPWIYSLALFFGLIHGLAFANLFLSLEGREGLVAHLLAFNIGIEIAQLVIVLGILLLSYVFVEAGKLSRIWWLRTASSVILVFSLIWAVQRFPYQKNAPTHDEKVRIAGNPGVIIAG